MRSFIDVCFAVVCTGNARASFDLMYVADAGTKAIHRVDPVNNVYLGRFGQGFLNNPISVALGSGSDVHVLDISSTGTANVKKFDGSTGEFLSVIELFFFPSANAKLRVSGNSLLATGGSAWGVSYLFSFDILSGNANNGLGYLQGSVAGIATGLAVSSTTTYWSGFRTAPNSHSLYQKANSSAFNNNVFAASATIANSFSNSYMAVSGSRVVHVNSGGNLNRYTSSLTLPLSTTLTGYSTINGMAAGHDNLVHIAGMNAGGSFVLGKYFSNINEAIAPTAISGTGITDPRDIAVFLAPEPGSMIAIGAGLIGLLSRKKRLS